MRTRSFGNAAVFAARGGIFSALSTLILLSAQFFDVLDLSVATIAAVLLWLLLLEYGKRFALSVFAVTALLGFLLTPANQGVICYTLVIGWYPLLKAVTDQKCKRKFPAILIKILIFSLCFGLMIFLFINAFVGALDFQTLTEDFSLSFDPQHPAIANIAEKFNTIYFGLNVVQWMMVGLYMLFAPVFVLLLDLLLGRMTLFYALKLRPMLKKRGILKNEYR